MKSICLIGIRFIDMQDYSNVIHNVSDIAGVFQIFLVIAVYPVISALRSIAKSVRSVELSVNDFKVYVHQNFLTKDDFNNIYKKED